MYNEAITYFDKALAIDPNYKDAQDNKDTALQLNNGNGQ
jgi:tetratricopeptide (TPR) repeat protein